MSGVSKLTADRNQRILLELASKPGNDVCADCKARYPRWASHNLGIFLCMNCASIHRKIGTHITKVKSLSMDAWTKEQVEVMKSTGNVVSNAKYNPDEIRHPPPTNREESERDSELEKYIRWKYEFKRYMAKPSSKPPPTSAKEPITRSHSTPAASIARDLSSNPPLPTASVAPKAKPRTLPDPSVGHLQPSTPVTQPRPHSSTAAPSSVAVPPKPVESTPPRNPVWEDILSLAGPSGSLAQPQRQPITHPPTSVGPYTSISSSTSFTSSPSIQTTGFQAAMTGAAPFGQQPVRHSSLVGNPFSTVPQHTGATGQMAGIALQREPVQAQSFVPPPFAQPLPTPFPAQPMPAPVSVYATQPVAQQGLQQQPVVQSSVVSFSQGGQSYQQQLLPVQSSNPFVSWPQQPGVLPQNTFIAQQQTGFSGQSTGFPGQQSYGPPWNNMMM